MIATKNRVWSVAEMARALEMLAATLRYRLQHFYGDIEPQQHGNNRFYCTPQVIEIAKRIVAEREAELQVAKGALKKLQNQ